ncbi:predicted protein [Plenodomus lingam JN3]|uniref:Predicted protein n=1 Tax=Leptosphaeria maculans (strain JN3 / isolate v23.1.3 / race Av1-4-5-6-7-8) TaxID=985895 RepID=E4ZJQ2_LEPMJ|nr:predicted protein [Plenodomus lingam JN3]CBX91337.1 predicted protein [Plenodomus lingam JN3]
MSPGNGIIGKPDRPDSTAEKPAACTVPSTSAGAKMLFRRYTSNYQDTLPDPGKNAGPDRLDTRLSIPIICSENFHGGKHNHVADEVSTVVFLSQRPALQGKVLKDPEQPNIMYNIPTGCRKSRSASMAGCCSQRSSSNLFTAAFEPRSSLAGAIIDSCKARSIAGYSLHPNASNFLSKLSRWVPHDLLEEPSAPVLVEMKTW